MIEVEKKRKTSRGKIGSLFIILVAVIIMGGYYYMNSRVTEPEETTEEMMSLAEELLLRNLETNYPPTPKEVARYYCDISQCFYDNYSEDVIAELAIKSRGVLDDELVAEQTDEEYLADLKEQIAYFSEKGVTISSYALSPSVDVEYFTEDGYSFARLYCVFSLREETRIVTTEQIFLLRQDEDGHWKIYGFALAGDED
jgi:hypothetical protein